MFMIFNINSFCFSFKCHLFPVTILPVSFILLCFQMGSQAKGRQDWNRATLVEFVAKYLTEQVGSKQYALV